MKYIDADRLKAKLDEHYRNYQSKYMETRTPYTQGLIDALDLAEQAIDSLQQEQPEVDLEKEINSLDDAYFDLDGIAVIGATYYLTVEDLKNIARHFFSLGLNAKEENK